MALMYRDQVFHDAGCACCIDDAAPLATDPTGTASIRRQWRLALGTRWTLVRNSIRQNLIDRDMLGMNGGSVTSSMVAMAAASQGETKIKTFQNYLDMTLSSVILSGDGATAKPFIELAYQKGLRFARTITGQTLLMPPQISTSRIDAITALAVVELQGIAEAVSQKSVREVANALIQNKRAIVAFRAITTTIEKIGVSRSNAVVELLTVTAFNAATLDYYQALGINEVGLLPEAKVGDSITDAKKKKARKRKSSARPRKGAGTRISRKKQPSASTIARILRKEQQLEGLGAWVNVKTAGDEKVCPICEDIEEGGPYKIDAARALIPAHPRCRCAFVPARKPRTKKKS